MPNVVTRLAEWTNARRKLVWLILFRSCRCGACNRIGACLLIMPFKAQTPRGRQLKKVSVLEDYWFDWRIYHPDTIIYQIGPR